MSETNWKKSETICPKCYSPNEHKITGKINKRLLGIERCTNTNCDWVMELK